MEIIHRPGKHHINADALSHLPVDADEVHVITPVPQLTSKAKLRTLYSSRATQICFADQAFPITTRSKAKRTPSTQNEQDIQGKGNAEDMQERRENAEEAEDVQKKGNTEDMQQRRENAEEAEDVQKKGNAENMQERKKNAEEAEEMESEEIEAEDMENKDKGVHDTEQGNIRIDSHEPGIVTTTIHLHPDISSSIVRHLPGDRYFGKIYRQIMKRIEATLNNPDRPTTTLEQFRVDRPTKFLYLHDPALQRERLCVPYHVRKKVFEVAHDQRAYQGIHRTYKFLRTQIFMPKLKRTLSEYIVSCLSCRLAKPSRQRL